MISNGNKGFARRGRTGSVRLRLAVLCILAVLMLAAAALAEYITPYDPYLQDLSIVKSPPSPEHILGTDRYGRDMLSRVIMGGRISLSCSLFLVAITAIAGTAAGVVSGWRQGWTDAVLMKMSDMFLAFPEMVMALAVAGILGGGMRSAMLALAVTGWPKYARIARGRTISVKETVWMRAARLSGSSGVKLVLGHVLPNIMGTVLTTAVTDIGTMIAQLAALGFLGFGVKPPAAEWGSMMSDARGLIATAPWIIYAPGFAIFMTVVIFNLLGDTIRDYADPKRRGR